MSPIRRAENAAVLLLFSLSVQGWNHPGPCLVLETKTNTQTYLCGCFFKLLMPLLLSTGLNQSLSRDQSRNDHYGKFGMKWQYHTVKRINRISALDWGLGQRDNFPPRSFQTTPALIPKRRSLPNCTLFGPEPWLILSREDTWKSTQDPIHQALKVGTWSWKTLKGCF